MALAACSSTYVPAPVKKPTKEYFSEKTYGKASPRRVASGKPVPKGGGRYHIGKPYRVAGKTYVPRDEPNYSATGLASWYGEAFHGRQTANGEIYDMNDLTAAHPTLPLPSYARVTNLENGRSVVVRINDRGPFAHNRVIDVSKAVAGILDFQRKGTAKVQVDYIGRAGLDGRDRNKLMASYRGPGQLKPSRTLALAERSAYQTPAPLPKLRTAYASGLTVRPPAALQAPQQLVPAYQLKPVLQPDLLAPLIANAGYATSFAPTRQESPAASAASALATGRVAENTVVVQVATFSDAGNARRLSHSMSSYGRAEVVPQDGRRGALHVVRVAVAADRASEVIAAARRAGLNGAFVTAR